MTTIVLASQSTSRRRLLESAGLFPTIIVSHVDEETEFFNSLSPADMVIALERNLSAGDNMANIRVLKNRFNGQTGQAGTITFNGSTGRMTEDLSTAFKPTPSYDDDDPYGF
jgi:hypothetical protein